MTVRAKRSVILPISPTISSFFNLTPTMGGLTAIHRLIFSVSIFPYCENSCERRLSLEFGTRYPRAHDGTLTNTQTRSADDVSFRGVIPHGNKADSWNPVSRCRNSLRLIRTSVLHQHPACVLDSLDLRHRVGDAIVPGGPVGGELKICPHCHASRFSGAPSFPRHQCEGIVAMTSFPLPGSPSGQIHFFHVTGSTHSCGNRGSQVR